MLAFRYLLHMKNEAIMFWNQCWVCKELIATIGVFFKHQCFVYKKKLIKAIEYFSNLDSIHPLVKKKLPIYESKCYFMAAYEVFSYLCKLH